jgi:hypothetical protein
VLCAAEGGKLNTLQKEDNHMPLYLDEIFLNVSPPENAKKVQAMFKDVLSGKSGFPPGVTLKAGPWASNEEAKMILVLDIQDHAKTFVPFATLVSQGLITKRRLTPIVEWSAVDDVVKGL